MFVPKHKRKDNLLATQEALVDKLNDTLYYGPYFETSNGKKYSGESPFSGEARELENFPEDFIVPGTETTYREGKNTYDVLRNDPEAFKLKFTAPLPVYFPTSIPAGTSFKRYFAKDIRSTKIVEISKETYQELKDKSTKYYYPAYITVEVDWVVEGLLEDKKESSYIIPSISSQNRATVEKASIDMSGLLESIVDFAQFAR